MSKFFCVGLLSILVFSQSGYAKDTREKRSKTSQKQNKGTKTNSVQDKEIERRLKTLKKITIESEERRAVFKLSSNSKVDIVRVGSNEKVAVGNWKISKGFLLINYGSGKERERIRYLVQLKKNKILINQRMDSNGYWMVDAQPQAVKDNQVIQDVKPGQPETPKVQDAPEVKEVIPVEENSLDGELFESE